MLSRPDTLRSAAVAPGVTYEFSYRREGPWAIHRLIVEPHACAEFRAAKAADRRVGRERTSALAARVTQTHGPTLLAAVNADFFSYEPPGVSEGPQVSAGVLLKSEGTHREAVEDRRVRLQPVFAVPLDGTPQLTHTTLRGRVRVRAIAVPLRAVNAGLRDDAAVLFSDFWGDTTAASPATVELIATELPGSGSFARRGVIVRIDTAAAGVALPHHGFVVATSVQSALARAAVGDTVVVTAAFDSLHGAPRELIGGYPMLLRSGRHVHHAEPGLREAFADRRHPRVAIGIDRRRRVHILVVDGRNPGVSEGMTLQELADYLLRLGVRDALNFDGGGSSTMVVRGRIVNRPSDEAGERAVANALLILEGTQCRR